MIFEALSCPPVRVVGRIILDSRKMTMEAPETEIVEAMRVACDGGEGALEHPRVWLSIPLDRGWIECGYCDKRFIHRDFAERAES